MIVIFSDASLDPDGFAGWGCWIKAGPGKSIEGGGALKQRQPNIFHAELAAIANAVALAIARGVIPAEPTTVMVQSDSLEALGALQMRAGAIDNPAADGLRVPRRRRRVPYSANKMAESVRNNLKGHVIQVRHVRGHKGGNASTGQGRNWVNRRCDKLAKAGRLAAREASGAA